MSWEHHEKTIKCPCGKSTITHRSADNDFGQEVDYGMTIDCPECREIYEFKVVYTRSDDRSEVKRLVRKGEQPK